MKKKLFYKLNPLYFINYRYSKTLLNQFLNEVYFYLAYIKKREDKTTYKLKVYLTNLKNSNLIIFNNSITKLTILTENKTFKFMLLFIWNKM